MEDSYLTQPWVFEMQEGENISLLCWMIFICIPSEISWEMGYPLLRRSFMRECIAGICTGLARGGKKASWPVPVRCIGGQNWWLELVAKLGGKNRWQEPIQNQWPETGGWSQFWPPVVFSHQNWWPSASVVARARSLAG